MLLAQCHSLHVTQPGGTLKQKPALQPNELFNRGGQASTSRACAPLANRSLKSQQPTQRHQRKAAMSRAASGADTDNVELFVDGQEQQVYADDSDAEEPDWVDDVTDWYEFWQDDGAEDMDDEHDAFKESPTAEEKVERILSRMPELRKRDDFISVLPVPFNKQYHPDLPGPDLMELNPDWDEFDFRAYVEKQARKKRDDQLWYRKMAEVGRFQYVDVSYMTDLRLQVDQGVALREMTPEETWALITMDGTAADPASIVYKTENPFGRADLQEVGSQYVESTEDFLRRKGHWLEAQVVPQQDNEVTLLSSDFEDFEDISGAQGGLSEEAQEPVQDGFDGASFDGPLE